MHRNSPPVMSIRGEEIVIEAGRLVRWVIGLIVVLLVVGTAANVVIHHVAPDPDHRLARAARRLDLGHEPSLPNWYSSLALVSCSGAAWLVHRSARRLRPAEARGWAITSVILLLMAIDEAILLHEMADKTLHEAWQTRGILHFASIVPGMVAVAFVGLLLGRWCLILPPRTRYKLLAAAALFVGGAIGMEMIAGLIADRRGVESLAHACEQFVEEGLEMLGVLVAGYAMLEWLAEHVGSLHVRISTNSSAGTTGSERSQAEAVSASADL